MKTKGLKLAISFFSYLLVSGFLTTAKAQCGLDTILNIQHSKCSNQPRGSIDFYIGSFDLPYTVNPSFGSPFVTSDFNFQIDSVPIGTHTIITTDGLGCSDTTEFTINHSGIDLSSIDVGTVSCGYYGFSFPDNIVGGVRPFTTIQSHAGKIPLRNLDSVVTWITLTDDCGMSASDTAVIYETSDSMSISITTTPANCNFYSATSTATPSGGSAPYLYEWYYPNIEWATTQTATGLPPGPVQVLVTDNNGCWELDTVNITQECDSSSYFSGLVFEDLNENGVMDVGEKPLSGIRILTNEGPRGDFQGVITNSKGRYYIFPHVFLQDTFSIDVKLPYKHSCDGFTIGARQTFPDTLIKYMGYFDTSEVVVDTLNFGIKYDSVECGTISGHVFFDENNNGLRDVSEKGFPDVLVNVNNGKFRRTDMNGNYELEVPLNEEIVLSVSADSKFAYYCPSGTTLKQTFPDVPKDYTITLTNQHARSDSNDFGIYSKKGMVNGTLYSLRVRNGDRPGLSFCGFMDFKIRHAFGETCKVRVNFDSLVDFQSASITPTTVTETYIEWDISPDGNQWGTCMMMCFEIDNTAIPGTELEWSAEIMCPDDSCEFGNQLDRVVTLVGSGKRQQGHLDHNDIEVFSTNDMEFDGVVTANDTSFSYVISFQNVSEDTLYNLVIKDTLPDEFVLESVSSPFSSHPNQFQIDANNRVLTWVFDGLNLPDTGINRGKSYGFVQYNVILKKGIPPGTEIESKAHFYYNRDLDDPVSVSSDGIVTVERYAVRDLIEVMPNPFRESTTISIPDHKGKVSFSLYNSLGELVIQQFGITGSKFTLNERSLPAGVYLFGIGNEEGTAIGQGKLIKQ